MTPRRTGIKYDPETISKLHRKWNRAIDVSLMWFRPSECFRRELDSRPRAINRALFDLTMALAGKIKREDAPSLRSPVRSHYKRLLKNEEFGDLISRAVDHTKRTKRRNKMWNESVGQAIK
jgi:hypothetical protein